MDFFYKNWIPTCAVWGVINATYSRNTLLFLGLVVCRYYNLGTSDISLQVRLVMLLSLPTTTRSCRFSLWPSVFYFVFLLFLKNNLVVTLSIGGYHAYNYHLAQKEEKKKMVMKLVERITGNSSFILWGFKRYCVLLLFWCFDYNVALEVKPVNQNIVSFTCLDVIRDSQSEGIAEYHVRDLLMPPTK